MRLTITALYIVFVILSIIVKKIKCGANTKTQKNNHQNISTLLDNLLRGYDNSVRPDFGGEHETFVN